MLFLDCVILGADLRISSEDGIILKPHPWLSFEDHRLTKVRNPGGGCALVKCPGAFHSLWVALSNAPRQRSLVSETTETGTSPLHWHSWPL